MAKMFDKISLDFMNAIKGVLEAKSVNKHGHDHVGKEDDDIDNDGDTDKSDKYLHNRRKAIGKAMMKKEESEQVDEMSSKMKMKLGLYGKKKKMKEEAETLDELSTKTLRNYRAKAKDDAYDAADVDDDRRLRKRSMGSWKAGEKILKRGDALRKEEAETLDELSKDTMRSYMDKASDARAHSKLPTKKVDNRYSGVQKASSKLAKEEVEQVDEISKATMGRYINKAKDSIDMASYRQGNREALGGSSKPLEKKLTKRHKGISMAVDKLTKEEIEMIEAKMAGVAPGALDCDKHMCATKVFHKEWNEGTPIKTMHADPDAEGLIEWYDVMFDHGIERVMTEDMEVLQAESHMHSKKKMKEEAEELDESAKVVDHLIKRYGDNVRKSHVMSAANDFGVGYTGLSHMVRKKLGVDRLKEDTELEEGEEKGGGYDGMPKGLQDRSPRGSSRGAMGRATARKERNLARARMDRAARGEMKSEETSKPDYSEAGDAERIRKRQEGDQKTREAEKEFEKRAKAIKHAKEFLQRYNASKGVKEEVEQVDEARGRPKKAGQMDYTVHPITKEKLMHNNPEHMKKIEKLQKNKVLEKPKTEANQHIMNQLQKAKLSMQGGSTIQFTHGQAKHVSGTHAAKLLTKYAGMKPDEKEAFQKKIGHSHEELMKHV